MMAQMRRRINSLPTIFRHDLLHEIAQKGLMMHAYKVRPDESYAPEIALAPRGELVAISDDMPVSAAPSPARAMQQQLEKQLNSPAVEWIAPGRRVAIVGALAVAAWMPIIAVAWAIFG